MTENHTGTYPLYSCNDENFTCLLELIKRYYGCYDMFLWNTTIEGALITRQNSTQFMDFMREYLKARGTDRVIREKIDSYRHTMKKFRIDFAELHAFLEKIQVTLS